MILRLWVCASERATLELRGHWSPFSKGNGDCRKEGAARLKVHHSNAAEETASLDGEQWVSEEEEQEAVGIWVSSLVKKNAARLHSDIGAKH